MGYECDDTKVYKVNLQGSCKFQVTIVIRSEHFTPSLEMWESRDFIIFVNHMARWHISSDISRNMCS